MSKRIIGRVARPEAHGEIVVSATEALEGKLMQLNSLLFCIGSSDEWLGGTGQKHRKNLMGLASDLAGDAVELAREVAAEQARKPDAIN
jgi:hypothetical protein